MFAAMAHGVGMTPLLPRRDPFNAEAQRRRERKGKELVRTGPALLR